MFEGDFLTKIMPQKLVNNSPVNTFILHSKDYASDQIMRIMASLMFHATVGKEFKDAL